MKVNNCCLCFSVKTGAIAIGAFNFLDVINSLVHFHPAIFALKITVVVLFIMMMVKDTESKRLYYCMSYLTMVAIECLFEILVMLQFLVTSNMAEDSCLEIMEGQGKVQEIDQANETIASHQKSARRWYESQEQCEGEITKTMVYDFLFFLLVQFVIQLHFCLVLWTHYKNSGLTKDKGGLVDDLGIEIQNVSVPSDLSSQVPRVAASTNAVASNPSGSGY